MNTARHRTAYDLPKDLSTVVSNVARELDVSSSDVAAYLLRQALDNLDLRALRALRVPCPVPCRWGFALKTVRYPTTRQEGRREAIPTPAIGNDNGD